MRCPFCKTGIMFRQGNPSTDSANTQTIPFVCIKCGKKFTPIRLTEKEMANFNETVRACVRNSDTSVTQLLTAKIEAHEKETGKKGNFVSISGETLI